MTSKRPPRRDPRAEDSVTPPADDLSVRRSVANRPPLREHAVRAPGAVEASAPARDGELGQLLARLGDAESKRRRAEVFADALAQKVVTLEAEMRGEREKRASETPPPPVDVDAKVSEALAQARAEWLHEKEMLEAASEIALRSERELLTKERAERLERESKTELTLRLERERIARERALREQAEGERDVAEAAKTAAEGARLDAEAARLQATSERDAARKALEVSIAEGRQLRASLDAMTKERDEAALLALSRERDEVSGPRVNSAAMSAARAVIARLERHEQKLASLRTDALRRVLVLLSEADASSNSRSGPLPRPTGESPVSQEDRKTGSVPPPVPLRSAFGVPDASGVTPRPMQRALDVAAPRPAPVKRTQQGLAVLPRGAFVDVRNAVAAATADEEFDELASRTVEIEVD